MPTSGNSDTSLADHDGSLINSDAFSTAVDASPEFHWTPEAFPNPGTIRFPTDPIRMSPRPVPRSHPTTVNSTQFRQAAAISSALQSRPVHRDPRDMGSGSGIGRAWELKPSNIDQSAASDGSVEGKVKVWLPLHQGVLPNQLKSLGRTPGLLKSFVMSSPSYSATSPAPLISDMDVVIVYNSKGEEFERRVVHGGGGFPGGDVEGVPPLRQIPQAEVMAEEFARALAQARGPLMLEQCQNKALCVLCAWQGEACVFDAPSMGSRLVSSMRCHGAGVGQGLGVESAGRGVEDPDVGGGEHGAVCGAGGASAGWAEGGGVLGGRLWEAESLPAIRGGAQQEAVGAQADGRSSRILCLLSYPGCGLGTGIKFSGAPAFDHRGLPSQAGGGANGGVDSMGGGALTGEVGLRHGAGGEGGVGVGMEYLGASGAGWEAQPMEEVEEREMAPEGCLLQAELEVARRREDWLANEATLGRVGILCWVWEHQVLLDGASAAFASIQDGLAQMPVGQPLELQQGMARVGRLLAGHQQCNAVALGLWWEVAADTEEALPGLAEVLAVVQAQMEIDLGVGMVGVLGKE
ncbi:hypothetical protein E4T56_gene3074 [Termitomyces sp. T112]|nr:hypothetical protein E4T56_gene3074 [Termitomyces sp. T112]